MCNDNRFILYKSRAIVRYLVKKHANQGMPELILTGLKEEVLFEQAVSIKAFNFNLFICSIVANNLFKLQVGPAMLHQLQTDIKVVKEWLAQLNTKLDTYKVILIKQRYLAGDMSGYPDLFKGRPSVERWWNELYNRPTWQEIISSN
ncbi:hypothetical protein ID866_9838 [Astraeus odoratus]|nr:hypothetical protein ID866_9838 [Astraeus odoratus]